MKYEFLTCFDTRRYFQISDYLYDDVISFSHHMNDEIRENVIFYPVYPYTPWNFISKDELCYINYKILNAQLSVLNSALKTLTNE